MEKPILFIDLDRTVLDTDKFYAIMVRALSDMTGTAIETIDKIYKSHAKGSYVGDLLHYHDFMGIINELGVEFEQIRARVLVDTENIDLLCTDAQPLISWAGVQSKFEPMLLSFGAPEIQRLKAECCKQLNTLVLHTTLIKKYDYISQNFPGRSGTLVDDKADQRLPDGWTELNIDRSALNYSKPVQINDDEWRITDLKDVEVLIG